MQINKGIPSFPATLKQQASRSLNLAADWAVRNQIRDAWPAWNANKGRFPYHVIIDPRKRAQAPQMWSTCWKTARTAQGLYSAARVTGEPSHLDAANRAMEYVATLQVFEPGYEDFRGSFREDSPQGPHVAARDGIEAVQGFIAGYLATKNERYLRRAIEGAGFLLRAIDNDWWPFAIAWPLEGRVKHADYFFFYAGALVFAQLYGITGHKPYLTRGCIPWADKILREHVRPDGALGVPQPAENTHHLVNQGQLAGVYVNDDGVGEALLCAYAVTGKRKYLDAAVGFADFWADVTEELPLLAAHASVALFLADVYRLTRDRKYLPKIEEYARRILSLQCLKTKDPMLRGCFIGEDMATSYDKKSQPMDYVDLRITSYSLIALAKIAARAPAQWGCAYSCFGW